MTTPTSRSHEQQLRWLVDVAAAIAVTCVVVTVATVARSGSLDDLFLDEPVAGLVLTALGWRLATRVRGNPIGWLLLAGGLGGAVAAVTNLLVLRGTDLSTPAMRLTALLGATMWMLPFAVVPQLLLRFPDGRLATRWHRTAAVLAGLGALGVMAGFAYPALVLPPETSLAEIDFQPPALVLAMVLGGATVSAPGCSPRWAPSWSASGRAGARSASRCAGWRRAGRSPPCCCSPASW